MTVATTPAVAARGVAPRLGRLGGLASPGGDREDEASGAGRVVRPTSASGTTVVVA